MYEESALHLIGRISPFQGEHKGSSPLGHCLIIHKMHGGCSLIGRAMHCECMCCGFESRHSPSGYDGMVDMSGLDFDK